MSQQTLNHVASGQLWPNAGEYRTTCDAGTRHVWVGCPGCGKIATLDDHTIDQEGNVQPSLVCPHGCGFHESVALGGWEALGP